MQYYVNAKLPTEHVTHPSPGLRLTLYILLSDYADDKNMLKPNMTSSIVVFCPTDTPEPRDNQPTVT